MKIGKNSFVHKSAVVEGRIEIGDNSSVWAGAVLRGDEGRIRVGNNTSVQDNCVIHNKTEIGDSVTIGHSAVIHGCRIGNNVLIGMNATILTGAEIGDWVIVAAGSVVKENQGIPSNSLAAGVPAKVRRELTEEDRKKIRRASQAYLEKLK